jgi:hypothetical protein
VRDANSSLNIIVGAPLVSTLFPARDANSSLNHMRIINHIMVSSFPYYGDPHIMERGRETKNFAFGDSP